MSRTLRRGKPSRDLKHYQNLGAIRSEYFGAYHGFWKEGLNDHRSYIQYATDAIRRYHSRNRQSGLPRYVREIDVSRQRREHRQLIHKAMRSADFDVALTTLDQRASWGYS